MTLSRNKSHYYLIIKRLQIKKDAINALCQYTTSIFLGSCGDLAIKLVKITAWLARLLATLLISMLQAHNYPWSSDKQEV